jgi:surface protein
MFYGATAFNQNLNNWCVFNIREPGNFSLNSPLTVENNPLWGQECNNFYLHQNGVTCLCPDAVVGETGTVNSVTYTKRTREQITESNASTTCTSGITDMSTLFKNQTNFNEDISAWDTSKVINMSEMFYGTSTFNQPIQNWDVSNVTNMYQIFKDALAFNQPIGGWNIDVATLKKVSHKNSETNNILSNGWDVCKVSNMDGMFWNAQSFNQPLNNWCVKQITSEPENFATSSGLSNKNKPIWGESTLSNSEFTNVSTQLTISPNPFTSSVKINLSENTQVNQIQVLNAVGQTVYTSAETEFNLEHLPAGIYFVKVNTNQGIATEKIIKN